MKRAHSQGRVFLMEHTVRGNGTTSGATKGQSSSGINNIDNLGRFKDKMCNIDIGMDTIARKIGMFYNIRTGNYIPDTPLTRRAYVKKAGQFELPINLRYSAGRFSPTTDKAKITLRFERTKKNRDYVVRAHGSVKGHTFSYANEDELRDKVGAYLAELNEHYDPDLQYTSPNDNATEWWLSSALQARSMLANRAGYSADYTDPFGDYSGNNFLADSDDEEDEASFTAPFGMTNKFGVKGALRYRGLNIYDADFSPSPDRCGWEYLTWVMGFDLTRITEIKRGKRKMCEKEAFEEDFWTMEEMMAVARYYNRNMSVYDLQGDKVRHYTNANTYDDTYFDVVPTSENKKRHMVFTIANGHIYPYTSKVQYALLKSRQSSATGLGATTKTDKYTEYGTLQENKKNHTSSAS